jgi:hypothetical protein
MLVSCTIRTPAPARCAGRHNFAFRDRFGAPLVACRLSKLGLTAQPLCTTTPGEGWRIARRALSIPPLVILTAGDAL